MHRQQRLSIATENATPRDAALERLRLQTDRVYSPTLLLNGSSEAFLNVPT